MIKKGTKVLVRTYSAGVHFGTLQDKSKKEVLLSDSNRIWKWYGALSLSEIASSGLDKDKSKISEKVEQILLTEAIEIIPINAKSNIYDH